jgi:hypothetical protein
MECFNQFQFYIEQQKTFTVAANTFTGWAQVNNYSWVVNTPEVTDFKVEGFKNINLYGVKMNGFVQSPVSTSGDLGIVDDYALRIQLFGTTPTISGIIGTNDYNIKLSTNEVRLGKWQNEVMFRDPIRSCTDIRISAFSAQGYSNQLLTSIKLNVILQVYFYYKYEGEDEDLLF